jgi:hypothetical protein
VHRLDLTQGNALLQRRRLGEEAVGTRHIAAVQTDLAHELVVTSLARRELDELREHSLGAVQVAGSDEQTGDDEDDLDVLAGPLDSLLAELDDRVQVDTRPLRILLRQSPNEQIAQVDGGFGARIFAPRFEQC